MSEENGITKIIDGEVYYKFDYADFLYEKLQERDKEIQRLKEEVEKLKEERDNYQAIVESWE